MSRGGRRTRPPHIPDVNGVTQSMEARLPCAAFLVAAILSLGAGYRTQNFVVTAQTPQLAQEVCEAAEHYRSELAVEWLGEELPPWNAPCPITVSVGSHLGAGGATQFSFANGRPFDWIMNIQGSRERLLDSVLPHEVTHTIFATHFGRPLPRWADEGACTTVEHVSEKSKQQTMLIDFLMTGRGIAFNQMFAMTEYPPDVLPLYAQGYSLARFLIAQGGKRRFMDYVGDGMQNGDWTRATVKHYGYKDLSELQLTWLDWVRRGCPAHSAPETLVAQQTPRSSTRLRRTLATPRSHGLRSRLLRNWPPPAKRRWREGGTPAFATTRCRDGAAKRPRGIVRGPHRRPPSVSNRFVLWRDPSRSAVPSWSSWSGCGNRRRMRHRPPRRSFRHDKLPPSPPTI